jgi:RNA polymerase sigma-70 factor (ECF subfamily)
LTGGGDPAASALLIARAQSGSIAALDALLRRHQASLYRHVRAITRDPDLALDVLQDAMLLIARRLQTLRDPRWFRAWAYRIATREAVRRAKRGRWLESVRADEDAVDAQAAFEEPPARLEAEDLEQLLIRVPPAAQAVLRLHYLDDMSFVEIAEALEIPIGTVKSRTAYGLAALRRALAQAPSEEANP